MGALDTNSLLWEEQILHQPTLQEVADVLRGALKTNFKEVSVEIVNCPDLSKAPYHLSAPGLCGSPRILEIGGPPYLLPTVHRDKLYDLKEICHKVYKNENPNSILAIGAGAGPWPHVNTNCEGIYNLKVSQNQVTNGSRLARIDSTDQKCILEQIPDSESRCALLANIFLSEGGSGQVLRVNCKQRIGEENFISAIRIGLANHFQDKAVGMGGVFLLKNGSVKQHVMRDFSKVPLNSEEELNQWLKFFEMPAELINVGTLVTKDTNDLDLRLQHFHNFSISSDRGGHYHYDTTPDIVEYEGFFNIGEKLVRIDKPEITHQFGRD